MNNPAQQTAPRTVPRTVTLLDGSQVELQLVEGADIAEATAAYQQRVTQKRHENRIKEVAAFAQNISTQPQQPPPPGSVSPGSISGLDFESSRGAPALRTEQRVESGLGTQDAPSRELLATTAAERGIDVRTGLDVGTRTLARVAGGTDDLRQLELINMRAEEDIREAGLTLPEGLAAVFVEEYTGEPAYYRVERDSDNKPYLVPTLINPPGVDVGDAVAASPVVGQLALESFGSGVGAFLGAKGGNFGMTAGAAMGAGTMAAVSNWTRQIIARSFDVPEEQVQRIQDDEMLKDFLYAAGGDAAVGAAFAIKRGISNHWFRPLAPETDIVGLQKAFKEATGRVMTLEDLIDEKLHVTLGMATGDPQMLALEKQVQMTLRDWWARQFSEQQINNELAMGSAVRRINQRDWPTATHNYGGPTEVGRRTLDVVQEPGRRAGARVEAAEEALDAAGRRLPEPDPNVWVNTQTLRQHAAEQFREAETYAWDTFRGPQGIDVDPETGVSNIWLRNAPNSPIRKFLRSVAKDNDNILAATYRESREKLLKDMNVDPSNVKALDGVFPSLADNALDYRQLHILVSYLKQNAVRMEDVMPGWSKQEVDGLISAIERQINVSPPVYGGYQGLEMLRQDPTYLARAKVDDARAAFIRDQWGAAKQATTQRYDFENLEALRAAAETRRVPGMPGEPVQARTVEFVNQADMVRGVFLKPGNSNALAELKHLEGFSPDLRVGLQSELLAKYRQEVFVDGKFSRTASDRFLQQYDGHMRLLFGDQGAKDIINVQNMSDALVRTERRAAQVNDIARQVFGKQVNMADPPQEVAREMIMGRYTPTQISTFRARIERVDPMLWDDIQQQGLAWVESQVAGGAAGKTLNFNALNKLIEGDTRRKLAGFYGQDYVDHLTVLRDVYGMMGNAQLGRGWATNVQTPLLQLSRSLLGPLSKKQRFITAMNRAMRSMGNTEFRRAVTNPEFLKRWVAVQRHPPGSYAAAHAALGLPYAMFMAVDSETKRQANIIKFFQQGGTVQQLERLNPEYFDAADEGDTDE